MSDEIRNKMYNVEITPPAGVWGKIVADLEVIEEDVRIADKVGSIGIVPPEDAWSRVSNALDTGIEKKVKSTGRIISLKRLAVAAAIIGIIAFSAIWILNNSKTDTTAAYPATKEPGSSIDPPSVNTETVNPVPEEIHPEDKGDIVKSKVFPAKNKSPENSAPGAVASNRSQPEEKLHTASLMAIADIQNASVTDEDRYYNLLDENGNVVRVSRKLAALQCVINNVSDIPFTNTPEERECLAKIDEWRNKMASAPAFTSPLDLIRVLSSNQ